MRQLRKFLCCHRARVLELTDIIQLDRIACLVPASRSFPLDHKTVSLRFRFYSTYNQSRLMMKIVPTTSANSFRKCSTSSDSKKTSLVENQSNEETAVSTTVVEKIKQTSETVFWSGIIFCGLTFALGVTYVIVNELFSGNSPHRIYSKAFKYVSQDERVQNEMGDQLKGFGEETRRGRRQHVSHIEYSKNGRNHLRMKFYIKGNRGDGSVNLEMIENDRGDYEYRYMFVVVESDPNRYKKIIILEDNRNKFDGSGKVDGALDVENLKELDLSMK